MNGYNKTLQMTYSDTAIMGRVTEAQCRMKKFFLRVWWRNAWTRVTFPLVFLAIGVPMVAEAKGEGIVSNIGMVFVVIAIVTFVIGFGYGIHSSARDVDRAMDEREERERREKGEGNRK